MKQSINRLLKEAKGLCDRLFQASQAERRRCVSTGCDREYLRRLRRTWVKALGRYWRRADNCDLDN